MPTTAAGPRPGAWWARWSRLAATAARRHWLLTLLLIAGLVLRVLAQIAYRPALFYIDTIKYLYNAYAGNDPPGYQFFLKVFLVAGNLDAVAAVQHLLGLGMAIALYALLLRRGVPRWLAALAAAPVLLDGYQLQIEQTVMPDVLFEALLVAGLVTLLWRNKPNLWALGVGGLLLGIAPTMWQPGEVVLLPVVIYALFMASGWRARIGHAVLIAVAFMVPIVIVSARNDVVMHDFSLAPYAGSTIYGRMAYAADCNTLKLTSLERQLCVPRAEALKWGPDNLDHASYSPLKHLQLPPGMSTRTLVNQFARQVVEQQPLRVAGSIFGDAIKLFEVHRVTSAGDTPIWRWQFQTEFPQYVPYVTIQNGQIQFAYQRNVTSPTGSTSQQVVVLPSAQKFGGGPPTVIKPIARFLRTYQLDGGFTPGPLLLLTLITGLIGSLFLLLRRKYLDDRGWEAARACSVILAAGVLLLLLSDTFEFSWRYQLPALMTLPPAGALGITVLIGFFAQRRRVRSDAPQPVTSAGPVDAAQADPAPAGPDPDGQPPAPDQVDDTAKDTAGEPLPTPSPAPVPEPAADEGMTVPEQPTGR